MISQPWSVWNGEIGASSQSGALQEILTIFHCSLSKRMCVVYLFVPNTHWAYLSVNYVNWHAVILSVDYFPLFSRHESYPGKLFEILHSVTAAAAAPAACRMSVYANSRRGMRVTFKWESGGCWTDGGWIRVGWHMDAWGFFWYSFWLRCIPHKCILFILLPVSPTGRECLIN
jgi:hypothetical protein